MLYANYCAELGQKSDDESDMYLEKARVYYRRALQRAQAVELEQTAGAPTNEVRANQSKHLPFTPHQRVCSLLIP
jgi:hypothetical protein